MVPVNPNSQVQNQRNTGQQEQSNLAVVADTGVKDVQIVTCGAFATFAQGDFIIVTSVETGETTAIWFDLDAAGTEPNGALYTATDNKIEVDIVTGNTATQVAAALFAAVDGNIVGVTCLNPSAGVVRFTQDVMGVCAEIDSLLEGEGDVSAGLTPSVTTAGVASNLLNKYFTANSPSVAYYVWLNVASEGVDPEVADKTGIEVAVSASDTAAAVATAIATVLEAEAAFKCVVHEGAGIQIINAATGTATDLTAGDSPFTVGAFRQGSAASHLVAPGDSPSTISNNPSAI